jgi:nucleotide-binding universal stress UspA family protein
MKIRPTARTGGVVVELRRGESQFPTTFSGQAPPPLPAFKLKSILVPVDFSDCSIKALQYAIPFAKQFHAELSLLYVVQRYAQIPEMARVDVESAQDGEKRLEELRRSVLNAVPVKTFLRTGEADAEIISLAKESGIDLIIISTHGRTGLAHVLLGSTAERIVRRAPCPVLVVRESEREFVANEPGLASKTTNS